MLVVKQGVHRTYTCANFHFQSLISIFHTHTHTCTPGGIQVGVQEGQYLSVVAVGYRERAEVCGGEGGTLLPLTAAELKAATSSLSTQSTWSDSSTRKT